MITNIYAVKDVKTGTFIKPFEFEHVELAKRDFIGACKQQGSMLNQYPADFELWFLCQFDKETGNFIQKESNKQQQMICSGLSGMDSPVKNYMDARKSQEEKMKGEKNGEKKNS